MSRRFRIFFTPKFSDIKDENGITTGDYKYFNKPFGVKYYLEHSDDFKWNEESGKLANEDDFIIIIDPDVSFLTSNECPIFIAGLCCYDSQLWQLMLRSGERCCFCVR